MSRRPVTLPGRLHQAGAIYPSIPKTRRVPSRSLRDRRSVVGRL